MYIYICTYIYLYTYTCIYIYTYVYVQSFITTARFDDDMDFEGSEALEKRVTQLGKKKSKSQHAPQLHVEKKDLANF